MTRDLRSETSVFEARPYELHTAVHAEACAYAEQRLNEWGWQYGDLDDDESGRSRRDPAIKEMMAIAKTWQKNRDAQKEREVRRRESARKAAQTRRAHRNHDIEICARCGHIHYGECRRCKDDPRYTALGKQTRSPGPLGAPARHVTATAEEVEHIVGKLPADMRSLLKACYCDHKTPWRQHAWRARTSWKQFKREREAAVEAVAERLAIGFARALEFGPPVPIRSA